MAESKIWLRRALQSLIVFVVSAAVVCIETASFHLEGAIVKLTVLVFYASLVSAIVCFLIHLMPPKSE